jgi:hypothetical protein
MSSSIKLVAFLVVAALAITLVQGSMIPSSSPARRLLQAGAPLPVGPRQTLPAWLENLLTGRTLGRGAEGGEPVVALLMSSISDDGKTEEEKFVGFIPPPEFSRVTGTPVSPTERIPHKHIGGVKYEDIRIQLGSNMDRDFLDIELNSFSFGVSNRKSIEREHIDIESWSWGSCHPAGVVEGPNGEGCTDPRRWPPHRPQALTVVYLSDGAVDSKDGSIKYPALRISNIEPTKIEFPNLDASSKDACYMTVKLHDASGSGLATGRRQYTPILIRQAMGGASPSMLVKQKAWLCSNFRMSFDVSEEPMATNIYHPCLGCPPPFVSDLVAKKGLNAVNVKRTFVEPPELTDDSSLDLSNPQPWQVESQDDWVVSFYGQRSVDFFLTMEKCSARPDAEGARIETNLREGNILTCREAGSGMATGRRQSTIAVEGSDDPVVNENVVSPRDSQSGMASGKRQHSMIVIPSDDPALSIYLHLEVQLKEVSRVMTSVPVRGGDFTTCDSSSCDFYSSCGDVSDGDCKGTASFSIVGGLASTHPPTDLNVKPPPPK